MKTSAHGSKCKSIYEDECAKTQTPKTQIRKKLDERCGMPSGRKYSIINNSFLRMCSYLIDTDAKTGANGNGRERAH